MKITNGVNKVKVFIGKGMDQIHLIGDNMRFIKDKLRFLKKNEYILLIWNLNRIIRQNRLIKKYSDLELITKLYKAGTGRDVDLVNANRYTEKLQWLKLYYRDKKMEMCADKYLVREYIRKKGYEYILNDVIGVWDNVDHINISELPQKFVLKATHGSGMNLIVKDKSNINWFIWKKIMKLWLKQNIFIEGREWVYENLKPKIICEKYMEDLSGELKDYKLICSRGNILFIQVDSNRFTNHQQTYYDTKWNKLPFTTGESSTEEEEPKNLSKMIEIASELSKDFSTVRVDLYNLNGKIYFGELTFFGASGFYSFEPDEYDKYWGGKVTLPKANYNQNDRNIL